MNIKEADQFMTDPLTNPDEKLLVTAEWLHRILRERHQLGNEVKTLRTTHTSQVREISVLKHRIMVAESNQPYTHIIDMKG
jgi:hypothetical protein